MDLGTIVLALVASDIAFVATVLTVAYWFKGDLTD